ncbi:MAG: PIG-L family deacetylase [Opitutaceae bacterium]|jgi:LmbE family N-acetylglucosaminyl deacetylase|nr:PIG-L family deacetylase [Opitutaceae bacterium]
MSIPFTQAGADFYVPDGVTSPEAALGRTTHLAIAAHQDDIEFMAYHGILECFGRADRWFSGVVVTDGAGSSRAGIYAGLSDAELRGIRRQEQRKAAFVGEYSAQVQLAHPSASAKDGGNAEIQRDLAAVLARCAPKVVYLHQPADKHDTHVGVFGHALKALRALPPERRPAEVYGCEGWRDLDWLVDADKRLLDTGARPNIAAALAGVFDSQITGGKRYDLGILGRRAAHATMFQPRDSDATTGITWAMDLTPLVRDPSLSVEAYTLAHVDRLRADIADRLRRNT